MESLLEFGGYSMAINLNFIILTLQPTRITIGIEDRHVFDSNYNDIVSTIAIHCIGHSSTQKLYAGIMLLNILARDALNQPKSQ
jgi:hypothetical protein